MMGVSFKQIQTHGERIFRSHVVYFVLDLVVQAISRWIVQKLGPGVLLFRESLNNLSKMIRADDERRVNRIELGYARNLGKKFQP